MNQHNLATGQNAPSGFAAAKKYAVQTLEKKKVGPVLQRLASMTQHEDMSPVLVSRLVAMDVEWSKSTLDCVNQELFIPKPSHCNNLFQVFNVFDRSQSSFVAQFGAVALLAKLLLEDSELNPADYIAHVALTTTLVTNFCQRAGHPTNRIAPAVLFHDIGFLVLASQEPQTYATLSGILAGTNQSLEDYEKANFGTTHMEVGKLLAMALQFDDLICGAISDHHHRHDLLPWSTQAIRLADSIAAELGIHLGIGVTLGHPPAKIEGINLDEDLILFASEIAGRTTKAAKAVYQQES